MAYTAFKESTLVLIDAVKNPELQHEMTQHIEGKFKVRGKDPAQAAWAELFSPSAHRA